jgi:hypothetical protein
MVSRSWPGWRSAHAFFIALICSGDLPLSAAKTAASSVPQRFIAPSSSVTAVFAAFCSSSVSGRCGLSSSGGFSLAKSLGSIFSSAPMPSSSSAACSR